MNLNTISFTLVRNRSETCVISFATIETKHNIEREKVSSQKEKEKENKLIY
jgi:hypothetical protein